MIPSRRAQYRSNTCERCHVLHRRCSHADDVSTQMRCISICICNGDIYFTQSLILDLCNFRVHFSQGDAELAPDELLLGTTLVGVCSSKRTRPPMKE